MLSCNLQPTLLAEWDLLWATAVTQRWNRYQNKCQHRKFALEEKILPLLLPGPKSMTFWRRIWRSNHNHSQKFRVYSSCSKWTLSLPNSLCCILSRDTIKFSVFCSDDSESLLQLHEINPFDTKLTFSLLNNLCCNLSRSTIKFLCSVQIPSVYSQLHKINPFYMKLTLSLQKSLYH